MKHLIQTQPMPIGIMQKNIVQTLINPPLTITLSQPFSAYQKPSVTKNKTRHKRLKHGEKVALSLIQNDFSSINHAQQLLLMQALWLGENKTVILQALFEKSIEVIAFVHWLAVPALGVVLSFSHQQCVKIEWL